MIDRTWIVGDSTPGSTSTPHDDIEPRRVIRPTFKTDVLGGAGSAARWLLAADPGVRVSLLGAWAAHTRPKKLVPGQPEIVDAKERSKNGRRVPGVRLVPTNLVKTEFTTTKWRLYEYQEGRPKLFARYDRDLSAAEQKMMRPRVQWPSPADVDVVIVDDFDKGLVCHKLVRTALDAYGGKTFILRAKDPQSLKLPWTILLCTVSELFRHAGIPHRPTPVRSIKPEGVHPDVVTALRNLKLKRENGKKVYVLVDGEGGLCLDSDMILLHALGSVPRRPFSVGAKDCFLAYFVRALLQGQAEEDATKVALRAATLCSKEAEKGPLDAGGWYVGSATRCFGDQELGSTPIEACVPLSLSAPTLTLPQSVDDLLARETIYLRDTDWYLPEYRTVDTQHGRQVADACERIRAYRKKPEARPLVIAIAAPPAAGKSHLAKALAKAAGCDYFPERVDAWSSMDDLYRLCERLRTSALLEKVPLAFLDEVDTKALGQEIYPRLLAPLWDKSYFVGGEKRDLGPCVFLLAGSGREWRSRIGKPPRAVGTSGAPKLDDLVSRVEVLLNIPPLAKRPVDAAVLVVAELRKRHPLVTSVAKPLLRALATLTARHGARWLGRALAMLRLTDKLPVDDVKRRMHRGAVADVAFPRNWDRRRPTTYVQLLD